MVRRRRGRWHTPAGRALVSLWQWRAGLGGPLVAVSWLSSTRGECGSRQEGQSGAPGTSDERSTSCSRLPCRGAGLGDGPGRAGRVATLLSVRPFSFFVLSCWAPASATRQVQVSSAKVPRLCCFFSPPLSSCRLQSIQRRTRERERRRRRRDAHGH
jgi:hypothetical protein